MKFIEVSEGLSIRIDEIEAISKREDMVSTVHTHHNSYDSTFPYEVLLSLIEREYETSEEAPTKEEEILNIFKQIGTFAG